MRPQERGDVDAWLLVALVFALQCLSWALLKGIAESGERAYRDLEALSRVSLNDATHEAEFFGEIWDAPAPRLDYGANFQKEKDADALCYIVRCCLSEADAGLYRCD